MKYYAAIVIGTLVATFLASYLTYLVAWEPLPQVCIDHSLAYVDCVTGELKQG